MLNKLKDLLVPRAAAVRDADADDPLQVAAATLMVEAALMDERFCDSERAKIQELLSRRFRLTERESAALIEQAEGRVRQSVELYGFTREVKDRLNEEERIELMEMLWQIAYVDGKLHDHEAALMRRLAGLLYITDQANGEARKRALERLRAEQP